MDWSGVTSRYPDGNVYLTEVRLCLMENPRLSVVVLAWNQLPLTRACVESLRLSTDVDYELVLVDNGSERDAASFAEQAADVMVLNDTNLGFAAGMNSGLKVASGEFVAFVNNDTTFPPGWAATILDNFSDSQVGICMPAVTAAGNQVTVRSEAGSGITQLEPFTELPSGVVYVMRTSVVRELGGWNESFPVASSEDLDLAFSVWLNDLKIVLDERVLVQHVSQASVRQLAGRKQLYADNLALFLDRWIGPDEIVRLASCDVSSHRRNRAAGRAAATWLRRLIEERQVSAGLRQRLAVPVASEEKLGWFRLRRR